MIVPCARKLDFGDGKQASSQKVHSEVIKTFAPGVVDIHIQREPFRVSGINELSQLVGRRKSTDRENDQERAERIYLRYIV